MISLSYTVSPSLKDSLDKIDTLRQKILLTSLPPKVELRLRWESMLSRLYLSLSLSGSQLKETEISNILVQTNRRKLKDSEQEIVNYKKGLDYVHHEWTVSTKTLTPDTILTLHNLISLRTVRSRRGSRYYVSEKSLRYFLDYLQSYPENPVIQAAIAQIEIQDIEPFVGYNGRVSRLLALLFLHKYGYDFRGFLVLEEYWHRHINEFNDIIANVSEREKLTPWLEFFAKGMVVQLRKVSDRIANTRFQRDSSDTFWKLNDRQREILGMLEQPGSSITNRKAQQIFKVSQVTASRDLAKLATLGLLFVHGKGRSVYYTRV